MCFRRQTPIIALESLQASITSEIVTFAAVHLSPSPPPRRAFCYSLFTHNLNMAQLSTPNQLLGVSKIRQDAQKTVSSSALDAEIQEEHEATANERSTEASFRDVMALHAEGVDDPMELDHSETQDSELAKNSVAKAKSEVIVADTIRQYDRCVEKYVYSRQ
jgi:hypothetical protein